MVILTFFIIPNYLFRNSAAKVIKTIYKRVEGGCVGHGNLACTCALVGDVLNEVGVACHDGLSFVIAQRYEKNPQSKFLSELRTRPEN
jgi:hypothetical protein